MPPTEEQILDICRVLSEQEELNVTVKGAVRGFVFAGAGAGLGTLIGGPMGMFFGGTIGSAIAALQSKDVKSVVEIINYDMTPKQRERLANSVVRALQSVSPEDIMFILPLVLSTQSLKAAALNEIIKFITNEMGMSIMTH